MKAEQFNSELDVNTSRLVDAYKLILKNSMILEESISPHEKLQILIATSSTIYHSQALLDQIQLIKQSIIVKQSNLANSKE